MTMIAEGTPLAGVTSQSKGAELAFVNLRLAAWSNLLCWSSNLQKIVGELHNLLRKLSYCRRVGSRTQLFLQFPSAPVDPPVSSYYQCSIKETSECNLCDSRRMATPAFPLLQGLQLNGNSSCNQPFNSLGLRQVVLISPFLQTQDDRGWSSSLLSSPFLLGQKSLNGDSGHRMGSRAANFPFLKSSKLDRQPRISKYIDGLTLTQVASRAPSSQFVDHTAQLLSHLIITRTIRGSVSTRLFLTDWCSGP
jgi:hypothetical protein